MNSKKDITSKTVIIMALSAKAVSEKALRIYEDTRDLILADDSLTNYELYSLKLQEAQLLMVKAHDYMLRALVVQGQVDPLDANDEVDYDPIEELRARLDGEEQD